MKSQSRFWALGLLLASACASGGADSKSPIPSGGGENAFGVANATSTQAAQAELEGALALLPSENDVRPANFYRLEQSDEPDICKAALDLLNRPYAVPEDLPARRNIITGELLGEGNYAGRQAAYYLGTNGNVRWSLRKIAWPNSNVPPILMESAFIDLYGDGVVRLVARRSAQLRGGDRRQIFVVEHISGRPTANVVNSAALGTTLADDKGFGAKMNFSVADIIELSGKYFTLIMPLQEYDKSGRVYLVKMYDRGPPQGNGTGHEISHWFPTVICTFLPTKS